MGVFIHKTGTWFLGGLVGLLLLSACAASAESRRVRLYASQDQPPALARFPDRTLRVAVANVVSPIETMRSYQELLDYLGERLARPVELFQRPTYAEINELLHLGNVDLAFVCSRAYVVGNQEFGLELLAMPEIRGKPEYRSYIIVPKDSPVFSFDQLRGQRFAFTDPLSNSGHLVPIYMLWQMGETPESFFEKTIYTYSHDNSIKAVAQKLVDGAAVDSLVYDYALLQDPLYASETRLIEASPFYGAPPVVVPPALDPVLKNRLQELLLSMDDDPQGRAILDKLMIDRFVPGSDRLYDGIRQMMEQVTKPRRSQPKP